MSVRRSKRGEKRKNLMPTMPHSHKAKATQHSKNLAAMVVAVETPAQAQDTMHRDPHHLHRRDLTIPLAVQGSNKGQRLSDNFKRKGKLLLHRQHLVSKRCHRNNSLTDSLHLSHPSLHLPCQRVSTFKTLPGPRVLPMCKAVREAIHQSLSTLVPSSLPERRQTMLSERQNWHLLPSHQRKRPRRSSACRV